MLFGHPLEAGETYVFEFRVDLLAAHLPDEEVLGRGVTWDPVCKAMRGFQRRGPSYTLETCFSPDDLPMNLRQVQLEDAHAEENIVRPLVLNRWHRAHASIEHPVAGLHGLSWEWPAADR
jgi:hypothetical protein